MANKFGGKWTKDKIETFIKYTKSYLEIMKGRKYYTLIYFDGFAGSGAIMQDEPKKNINQLDLLTIKPNLETVIQDSIEEQRSQLDLIIGVAQEILSIKEPREFDMYYFVEKNSKNADELKNLVNSKFSDKKVFVVPDDCNKKLVDLAAFLRKPKNKNHRVLAFIDPYGMQVEWKTIENLKGLGIDIWMLVPTGLGVNRLIKNDGKIEDALMGQLITFLGLTKSEILDYFYKKVQTQNLFDEVETELIKETKIATKAAELYRERLSTIFQYVSDPLVMKNSKGSIMYHFLLCSNNKNAIKIANDIVKPRLK